MPQAAHGPQEARTAVPARQQRAPALYVTTFPLTFTSSGFLRTTATSSPAAPALTIRQRATSLTADGTNFHFSLPGSFTSANGSIG